MIYKDLKTALSLYKHDQLTLDELPDLAAEILLNADSTDLAVLASTKPELNAETEMRTLFESGLAEAGLSLPNRLEAAHAVLDHFYDDLIKAEGDDFWAILAASYRFLENNEDIFVAGSLKKPAMDLKTMGSRQELFEDLNVNATPAEFESLRQDVLVLCEAYRSQRSLSSSKK